MKIGDKVVIMTAIGEEYIDSAFVTEIKDSLITVDSFRIGKCYFHKDTLLSDSKLRKIEVVR